VLIIKF